MARQIVNPEKAAYAERLLKYLREYSNILMINVDNVGSHQIAKIRHSLRGKAVLLMGKNTTIKAIINHNLEALPEAKNLLDCVKANCGFVFCNGELDQIKQIIENHKVPAAAKQGLIATHNVYVPAGPTGMDPGQTSFFQALGVATKIVKGQIEINSEVLVIKENEKVTASQATLLQKLNIRPFYQGVKFSCIFSNGSIFPASILDITNEDIIENFKKGVTNVSAFSLATGFPTAASIPHSVRAAFKDCAALALATDYSFAELESIKNSAKAAAPVQSTSTSAAPASNKPVAAPAAPEPESEEDDMGFGLFD